MTNVKQWFISLMCSMGADTHTVGLIRRSVK